MNERIKELFKEAGGHTSVRNLASNPVQVVETHELWDDHIEKFAELIVRECAGLCHQEGVIKFNNVWEQIRAKCDAQMILNHFGVEE
jgi:hypothetical protein